MASGPAIVAAASRHKAARVRQLGLAGMVVVDLRVIGTSAAVVVCARIATAAPYESAAQRQSQHCVANA